MGGSSRTTSHHVSNNSSSSQPWGDMKTRRKCICCNSSLKRMPPSPRPDYASTFSVSCTTCNTINGNALNDMADSPSTLAISALTIDDILTAKQQEQHSSTTPPPLPTITNTADSSPTYSSSSPSSRPPTPPAKDSFAHTVNYKKFQSNNNNHNNNNKINTNDNHNDPSITTTTTTIISPEITPVNSNDSWIDSYITSPSSSPLPSQLPRRAREFASSIRVINASFVTKTKSSINLNIDKEACKAFYNLINSSTEATNEFIHSLSTTLYNPGPAENISKNVRWCVLLVECQLVFDFNNARNTSSTGHEVLSRLLGLLAHLPNKAQHALVQYWSHKSYPHKDFKSKIDIINAFISARLATRYNSSSSSKSGKYIIQHDWKLRAAVKTQALFFAANKHSFKSPIEQFYNVAIDTLGNSFLINDFEGWENFEYEFSMCQYPFILSLGSKLRILGYDGERQMRAQAHQALIHTLQQQAGSFEPYFKLKVRRENLLVDSLRQISANSANLKKKLFVEFQGEEGVDVGGLRKEFFLLLTRQLFDPQFGMFTFDEDSNLAWFNPSAFESLSEYNLVGVVVGLAAYHSATLDIPLPLACYKKLKGTPTGLLDLAVIKPSLARGLKQLLDYPHDDVEETFCRSFVGEVENFGMIEQKPLIPNGQNIPVTKANKNEFVSRYVSFILDESVKKQFKAFRSGFFKVMGVNALSLFQPEELELMVRGSPEPIDIVFLKASTKYEGFKPDDETIEWFWKFAESLNLEKQRKLLSFITGTDRIPSTGMSGLKLRISYKGDDPTGSRFPTSHTCFNQICLYKYASQEIFWDKLTKAIEESEGFGLR